MVQFAEIIDKTVQVRFTKSETDGYSVEGTATYDKGNRLINANGNMTRPDKSYGGSFNAYRSGDSMRLSINDIESADNANVCPIIEATLGELETGYPGENG